MGVGSGEAEAGKLSCSSWARESEWPKGWGTARSNCIVKEQVPRVESGTGKDWHGNAFGIYDMAGKA
jgi:hypothetical protein